MNHEAIFAFYFLLQKRAKPAPSFGVSTGLISQGYWEQRKWYFVNVERGNIADRLQPRNINVSFTNNSNVAIEVIISSHSTATS